MSLFWWNFSNCLSSVGKCVGSFLGVKIDLIIQYLVLKMTEYCEESSAIKEWIFFLHPALIHCHSSNNKWWDPT